MNNKRKKKIFTFRTEFSESTESILEFRMIDSFEKEI